MEFIRKHYGQDLKCTSASKLLHETQFSVDRMHFKEYVGRWCRAHMNSYKNKSEHAWLKILDFLLISLVLDGVNIQAAEQLFS